MVANFKYAVEGLLVPAVSVFGLLGNALTVKVLNHREVKLKKSLVQILCGLATFDNIFLVFTFFMFTMPCLSQSYRNDWLPFIAPYLLPATNTLMSCSVYATVAVAINRYTEMTPNVGLPYWLEDGVVQCVVVFVFSVVFNVSRWFELDYEYVTYEANVTEVDSDTGVEVTVLKNVTGVAVKATDLRLSESYIRWYSLTVNSIVMNFGPTVIMIYCSLKVYWRLQQAAVALSSDRKMQARLKRNQSITRTLFGIILMFLVCHTGKIVISIYEVIYVFVRGAGVNTNFEPWAKHLIVLNTLLVVLNSSINFAFYCGDVVFRECLSTVTRGCRRIVTGGGLHSDGAGGGDDDDGEEGGGNVAGTTATATTRVRMSPVNATTVVLDADASPDSQRRRHEPSTATGGSKKKSKKQTSRRSSSRRRRLLPYRDGGGGGGHAVTSSREIDVQSRILLGIEDDAAAASGNGLRRKVAVAEIV